MWKDYFKGILNSESSANESPESVDHSIDCKEVYLGLEMPMCSFVSVVHSPANPTKHHQRKTRL